MSKQSTLKNKFKSKFTTTVISLLLLVFLQCSKNDKVDDSKDFLSLILLSQTLPTDENLPEPAINTVDITVGETKYTKALSVCRGDLNMNGQDNIMVPGNDQTLPLFYLHKVDFTAKNVFLTPQGPSFIFNIDMPGGGGYDPAVLCEAKVIENSSTTYDIQVKKCSVDKIAGAVNPPTNTISFRARCTKGL
ncbi:hypothetical protein [Leptospira bandrabouensis]|uniref:hypothetical protein n=1 Tax=Leptospira bandrabouensis TaxID=2484903 RepID=UPI001ABF825B|nr:hypothetical protein [Leptospira bandrabouensis]